MKIFNFKILIKNDENDIIAKSILPIMKVIYSFILMLVLNLKLFICTILVFVVLDINIFVFMQSLVISDQKENEC